MFKAMIYFENATPVPIILKICKNGKVLILHEIYMNDIGYILTIKPSLLVFDTYLSVTVACFRIAIKKSSPNELIYARSIPNFYDIVIIVI